MSEGFNFDYELTFVSVYDTTVLQSYNTPDVNDVVFQDLIANLVSSISSVLNIQQGVNQMSTYTNYNNSRYKITFTL